MSRILRAFPRRTAHTPTDELVAIGEPGLFDPPPFDEIHISCLFTWDRSKARRIAGAWARRYPRVDTKLGGPAFDSPSLEFVPGLYARNGISISSRGCPSSCPWCFVSKREGNLRLLDICPGYIVQDNNVLAFPKPHFWQLCRMLKAQSHQITFSGGLEAARLTGWHVDQLKQVRIRELWFAADSDAALPALRKAVACFKDLHRRRLRCYVLAGYNGESMQKVEARLEAVWDAGAVPFIQLYRDDTDSIEYNAEWRAFRRKWSRMRSVVSMHKDEA